MSIYANGLNIQTNEICFLEFKEQTQTTNGTVAMIAVQYDILKQMHDVIGQAIEQYEAGLHMVKSGDISKAN